MAAVNWSVSTDFLVLGNILPNGNGRFADVRLGTLQRDYGHQTVAVKLNKIDASESDRMLLHEKMNYLDEVPAHVNVLSIVAAVPPPQGPMIVMEHCELGRLSDWLNGIAKLSSAIEDQMQDFCKQVAMGMLHLHENQILHRRLGVRNILLTQDYSNHLVVKLTGFGPRKDEQKQSIKGDRIPLRWMAPEQFQKNSHEGRVYSKESDVWSYGILVYEVYSKGGKPYPNVTDDDIKDKVKHGYRMGKPNICPEFMYEEVMKPCWSSKAEDRPDFQTIITGLNIYFNGERKDDVCVHDIDDEYVGIGAITK